MYDNIGGKIKGLAKTVFIVEVIGAVITGIALLATDDGFILAGLLTLFCGSFVAWVSSWILYAFGEIVEDIHAMRNKYIPLVKETATCEVEEKDNCETKKATNNPPKPHEFVIPLYDKKYKCYECPSCGCTLKKGQSVCLCSKGLDWSNID